MKKRKREVRFADLHDINDPTGHELPPAKKAKDDAKKQPDSEPRRSGRVTKLSLKALEAKVSPIL